MRRTTLAALSFALVLGMAGCGEDDDEPAGGPSREQVQRALDRSVEAGAAGVAVQLNGPHGKEFLTAGPATLETADDQLRVVGISESFTAAIVLQLVEEGKLSLDESVRDLGPGVRGVGATITIRDLLTALDTRTAKAVLRLVIEEVTQNTYEEELETRIVVPLGLSETVLGTGGFGLLSTPADVAFFFESLMAGALVGRDEIEEMMEGLGIVEFEVSCGEVWGQTGNLGDSRILGAANEDGTASIAFIVRATEPNDEAILRVQELAICRALGEDTN